MAHPTVIAAVNQVLADWSLCPVNKMNASMEPPADGSPYLEPQFPFSRTTRLSVGTRLYHEEGGVRLVLCVPQGEGLDRLMDWSEQLAALFRDQKVDRVRFKAPSSPYLGDDNDDGSYFVGATVVPYFATYSG